MAKANKAGMSPQGRWEFFRGYAIEIALVIEFVDRFDKTAW